MTFNAVVERPRLTGWDLHTFQGSYLSCLVSGSTLNAPFSSVLIIESVYWTEVTRGLRSVEEAARFALYLGTGFGAYRFSLIPGGLSGYYSDSPMLRSF